MDRHEFRLSPYITLSWQLLTLSLAAAYALSCLLEPDIAWVAWLLPGCVLAMTLPYIARLGEIGRDLRRGALKTARLKLKDVSEEYALALHRQRGLVHWTLIFEDEANPGAPFSLSAAARRDEMKALFQDEAYYLVEWLPTSRVIRSARRL